MSVSLRKILNCIVLLSAFICCFSPVYALEIEWGVPDFSASGSRTPVIAPQAGTPQPDADWESAGLENGFRGASWGLAKGQMEDELHMEFVQCVELPGERLNCAVQGANSSIRDIPLKLLRYKFIRETFYGISFKYDSKYEKDMYAIYNEILGPPTGYRESFPVWHGRTFEAWATNTHFSFSSKKVVKKRRHRGGTF